MPKMKTKRAAAKRMKFTAAGKIKVKKAFLRHQLTCKSAGTKRAMRAPGFLPITEFKRVARMLPYGTR